MAAVIVGLAGVELSIVATPLVTVQVPSVATPVAKVIFCVVPPGET